ncbi:MAG TPA: NAD(P)H-dependent oxidoreductase [Patescibacteria group bacterium]
MKILVIIGTTRKNRFSEKPARWIFEEAKKINDFEVELVDLRDYPLPFYEEALSPRAINDKYENEIVKKWAQKIGEADGYIIVSGEYNHSYPAVLKNALDYIYFEWNKKPVAFVSYGVMAGARAVELLRLVALELQMVPIHPVIHIPFSIMLEAREQNIEQESKLFESLNTQKETLLKELIWWVKTLKVARESKIS